MISEELKLIVDKFNEQGQMNFLEETTEEKISEFEKERSVKLPTKFKEWLLFSDGGEFLYGRTQQAFSYMELSINH